ncbi:MAG: hypothetical protein PVG39_03205 [Desulfobacteraceae bacterium]|jgi:hypothetical protein
MSIDQPDFQSLRNIRDNMLLLSIANEYISENIYLVKFGTEIKKNLTALKDDIIALKKQFPGKFAQEVNTDNIMNSFETTAKEMLSGGDEIISKCTSGKLGTVLGADVDKITEAIDKIWHQVKGSDVKYTATDSISGFFDRLNIFSSLASLFFKIIKIFFIILIILAAGLSYLYFTMEKEEPILKENREIMAFIEEKKALISELEKKKADAQKDIKARDTSKLLRKDKIAIIDTETKIQELNQEIHLIEGQIGTRKEIMDKNNEKLEELKSKSFLDRLLRK